MKAKIFGTWTRIPAIIAALGLCAASASKPVQPSVRAGAGAATGAPPPRAMRPELALGVWSSSFGAVKIERDGAGGEEAVMGVWIYQRAGQEVVGFFSGVLRGNVLDFTWHEPGQPVDLTGGGYLVFNPEGGSFGGKWWTHARDRSGEWTGWRDAQAQAQPAGYPSVPAPAPVPPAPAARGAYGGQGYGGAARAPAPIPEPEPEPEPTKKADDPPPVQYDPSTDPFYSRPAPPPPL